ncbi:MAG: TrkA C-terminal domain-containing protein [Haliea sp.]
MPLPPGASVGAIARQEQVVFADRDTVIESGDHIILFLSDKSGIAAVERLFQVAIIFM